MRFGETKQTEAAPAAERTTRLLIVSVPILLLLAVVLAIGIVRARSSRSPSQYATVADNESLNDKDPLESCFHTMPIPFGMKARNECGAACYGPNVDRATCEKGCDLLVVTEFARAPRSQPLDATAVAALISKDCVLAASKAMKSQPVDEWRAAAQQSLGVLNAEPSQPEFYEAGPLIDQYARLEKAGSALDLPAEGQEREIAFARELQLAFCQRQSLTASQLAVARAAENGDRIGEKLYRALEQALREEISAQAVILFERKAGVLTE